MDKLKNITLNIAQIRPMDWLGSLSSNTKAYVKLLKLRLSMLVAVSAIFGYALAAGAPFNWSMMALIGLGGLMVTGASNILNQIFEKDLDALMSRTADRPIPTGQVSISGALIFALLIGLSGVILLGYVFNLVTALLGFIGLLLYGFVYTPMKRVSPFSVFVGAIPGALPPLIGWVAYTGQLDTPGILLFVFQFFWQFPHFWAIAWMLDDDYKKAGFKMLPTPEGRSSGGARLILLYTLCLVPLCWFPYQLVMINAWGMGLLVVAGILFSIPAYMLWTKLEMKHAKRLMFASFIYLPVIQLIFIFFRT
ncbi:MAG: heme o synthase [Bacteroidota bacterium]